jgi:hypothetical protein
MIDQTPFLTRILFAIFFIPFAIIVGELIHRKGRILVNHSFGEGTPVSTSVAYLLHIGWYLIAFGLLFWNLGVGTYYYSEGAPISEKNVTEVFMRIGVSVFVVGFLHGFNVLALSLFHKKNNG